MLFAERQQLFDNGLIVVLQDIDMCLLVQTMSIVSVTK
jgi:hypothetical protein